MSLKLKSITGKSLVALLAVSFLATPLLSVSQAQAGQKNWNNYNKPYVVVKKKKYNNDGDLLAAGVIGFALGAIIADQARPRTVYVEPQPVYVQPRPVYVQPRPVYVQPRSVYVQPQPYVERRPLHDTYYDNDYDRHRRHDDGPRVIRYEDEVSASYEPWTREWSAWCRSNYRSFNASTGTYRGYDGLDHFCVVK
jgi:hypothetical protein